MRLAGLHVGLGRRRRDRAVKEELKNGAEGRRVRPAPQRRRAPERGGRGRVGVPQGRPRRLDQGPRAARAQVYNATGGAIASDIPVVVLVDEGSASASEIVTGALQDRKRAKVVGTRTYGKGVFQEIERLDNGGALDITVGEYFTPTGRNLGGGGVRKGAGITPDIQASDDPETDKDEALDKALETVAAD